MDQEKYYKKVENILENFPLEYRKNYIDNKKTVIIKHKKEIWKSIGGSYDNDTNTITIYKEKSYPHELFHMAFRDSKKVGKKIWEDYEIYYENGISYSKYENNTKVCYNQGLTEGFAEYLSRKCCENKGQNFNYFFTDLLISIYGEDILKYPLQNDPKGLFLDDRFVDMFEFSKNLDRLDEAIDIIQLLANCKETFEKIFKVNDKKDIQEFRGILKRTKQKFKSSPILLFKSIINEYKHCLNPKINKENFTNKLEAFLSESEYSVAFTFDNDKYSVKEEITKIINKFKTEDLNTYKRQIK